MAAFVTNQVTTTFGRKRGGGEGGGFNGRDNGGHGRERDFTNNDETDFEGHGDSGVGSTTAALGVKWAHCVNTRLVLEGASEGLRRRRRRRVTRLMRRLMVASKILPALAW